ncbi:fungal-specific transcription factor domain-domain-containing protein [Tuber borchii]|uniref:Fungal-specific transcription factor domain-domain-containing protein n=1 Tax=Tuber borchii TaxID=42251 RepID=A0A2T6ZZC0_TUBBO|nr:fungal-specific transcription factor domain-domain-containing protein [Tuber borchii]
MADITFGSNNTGNSSRRSSPGVGAGANGGGGGGSAGRRDKLGESSRPLKRRCVSNACIACRRRKSKCDGNTPACAACASVYHTECVYDPNSDHRRKGVYKQDIDNLKTQNTTLHTLIEAILNYPEDKVFDLVKQVRTCDSLEDLAESIIAEQNSNADPDGASPNSVATNDAEVDDDQPISLEAELSGKMGRLRVEDGQVRFIGATSNLLFVTPTPSSSEEDERGEIEGRNNSAIGRRIDIGEKDPITTWTTVTQDPALINHLVRMYFAWHYPYFTTLSKDLFYKEFLRGKNQPRSPGIKYCTSLLVNAILALGCHFTCVVGSRANHNDPATAGDHFFKEAKRMILENDEHEIPRLTTVQALALMSVREAGCGREAKGWVYSGMSFRMAMDLGLHLDPSSLKEGVGLGSGITDEELDARRVTFWGCYLFDKCWSNYMGRMPQLPSSMVTVPKPDVFPSEDSDNWLPYTDSGVSTINPQPSRIRAVSLRISMLCEISNDVLLSFYDSTPGSNTSGVVEFAATTINRIQQAGKNGVQAEFKKLGELFARLEDWRKKLPSELEAKEGSLPSVLLMHMFHQTLYIHLFRPFLKSSAATNSTLSHLDPRKACLAAATMISKYLRFYKRRYGLRQICNVAGYFIHSACTIHLLNLQQKAAKRDIVQGLKSLEEIGECWLVAKRALVIVGVFVHRRGIELPEEAENVLKRCWKEGRRFGLGAQVDKILNAAATTTTTKPSPKPRTTIITTGPSVPPSLAQAVQPPPLPSSPHPPRNQSFPTQSPPPPPPPSIPRSSPQPHPTHFYTNQPPTLAYYTSPPPNAQYLSTTAPLSPSSCASAGSPGSELLPEFGIDQGLLEQCDNWWWRDTAELANEMAIDAPVWPGTASLSVVAGPGSGTGGGFDESGTGVFNERRE